MTRQFVSTAFIFLTVVAMALPTMAQDRRGGRGGFGGPGGPGGGFGAAARSSDMLMLGLLRSREVREEIDLMPDQVDAFRKLEEQSRENRPDFGRLRDASEDERRQAMQEMRENMEKQAKETREKMEEVLLPEQMARLNEIAIQQMGVAALSDPKVIAALKITDEQKEQMESIREESTSQIRELFTGGGRDASRERREEMREKLTEAREKSEKDMLAVLDEQQQAKLEEMKGKPFEMPEARGFGGRGGPGAQGADGRRRDGAGARGGDGRQRGGDGRQRGGDGRQRGGRSNRGDN